MHTGVFMDTSCGLPAHQDWDFLTREGVPVLPLSGTLASRSGISLGEKALSSRGPLRFSVNMVGGDVSSSSSITFSACRNRSE